MATPPGPAPAPGRTAAAPAVVSAQPTSARPVRSSVPAVGPSTGAATTPSTGLLAASRAGPAVRLTPTPAPQPAAPASGSARTFRTRDGKEIELPEGMTADEAARLEADALKAQNQLGKGPPPRPVPDVKQQVKKDAKKAAVKPKDGVKAEGRKGKSMRRAPPPPPAILRVRANKVAQYLAAKGLPVQQRGLVVLRQLRHNEQTHDDAGQKLNQSEKAVVNPPAEGQSKSNAGQVEAVSAKPAPAPSEDVGKRKLQASLRENTPKKVEDVDNFKRDMKAQHIGADVLKVVQGDTNAVGATFGDVKATPPPAPPEQTPQGLPPPETAPATPGLALGQGAIAPLQKEHTDVSQFTREADDKLKEEGVTQEQLDMVDSGDLAAANKEKKGMEQTAKTEPLAIQQFAQQENTRVGRELGQEEKQQRASMQAKRKAGLGATAQKQKGTKSALEKKREEVARHINGIYTRAQDSVKKKLADLETTSMKRFDDGNAKAAKDFEANVNREIDAFKADRYSGWFGWARRAKDWLLGIDDLPQVKAIFERNRTIFVNTINKLVEDITADNKKVIQGCKEELANAKKEIEVFVKGLKPGLQTIGKQAAAEMNAKLADLDGFINKKEEELQNGLKDKQTAAIKAIDEKIEKMKEAMSGALAKLGKLLLLAAKKFFAWALEKFGYSLSDIQSIIDKGVAVLKAIFTGPIKFVKNLMKAAMLGFEMFRDHFLTHLKNALFEWLTDSLEGIQLPSTWDLKGIIGVALQIVGITYANLRRFLVEELTEPVVVGLEKGASLIATLFREGPLAAWEQLKGMAAEISEAFQAAVKDYIKEKIIIEAVKWIVSLFIPGAGIIKAIIGIYDTIVFFVQKIKQIMKMIASFLSSIGEIAAGNIGAAAKAMEDGLARGLKLVISFLAQLLHLSGITNRIKAVLAKIRGKVDGVLKKLAHWIAMPLKKVYRVVKAGVQKRLARRGSTPQPPVSTPPAGVSQGMMDRSITFLRHGHTLRAQPDSHSSRILMASNGFRDLQDELVLLRRNYLDEKGGHFVLTKQTEAARELDKRISAILTRKRAILTRADSNRAQRREILHEGLDDLVDMVTELSEYMLATFGAALGPGAAVETKAIVYVVREDMGFTVKDIGVIRHGHFGILAGALDGSKNVFLAYIDHDREWRLPNKQQPPFYAGFSGVQGTGMRLSKNIQRGVSLGGGDAAVDPPGLDQKYNRRGHLVAKQFGGPGDIRNIVAMTETANHTNAGIVSIENDVRRDVAKGTVITYRATPVYGSKSYLVYPPEAIEVTADEEWPNLYTSKYHKRVPNG